MFRDLHCATNVGRMAALGGFDEELQAFGCAYLAHNKVTYRVSSNAEQIYQFTALSVYENLYPTSVVGQVRRTAIPAGMQEQLEHEIKMEIIDILHVTYPRCYFEQLEPFCQTMPNNSSYALLCEIKEGIDGHFDEQELQLLEGTLLLAYQAKLLEESSFRELQRYISKTRRQMEDAPVVQSNFAHTFYGFCYQNAAGQINCYFDARMVKVQARYIQMESENLLLAPILHQTYWSQDFSTMSEIRKTFQAQLMMLQNADYFQLLNRLRSLPGVIDHDVFLQASEILRQNGTPEAIADFCLFGHRWNVKNI